MSNYKTYRSCFVPNCGSTTIKNPEKLFLYVPEDEKRRKLWFKIARRADQPTKSRYYFSQDHFNIKEDMENYVKYSIYGAPMKLKTTVIPHLFDCQPQRRNMLSSAPRPGFEKLNRKREINEILGTINKKEENNVKGNEAQAANSAHIFCRDKSDENSSISNSVSSTLKNEVFASSGTSSFINNQDSDSIIQNTNKKRKVLSSVENRDSFINDINIPHDSQSVIARVSSNDVNSKTVLSFGEASVVSDNSKSDYVCSVRNVGVQVGKKYTTSHYRSKAVTCKPVISDVAYQASIEVTDRCCSPIKSLLTKAVVQVKSTTSSSTSQSNIATNTSASKSALLSEYYMSSTDSEEKNKMKIKMKCDAISMINYFISANPKYYIDVASEWFWIIQVLHLKTAVSIIDIKLTLMKIRLNDTFIRMGDQFGISSSHAGRIFNKTVQLLAHMLKTLIYPPKRKIVNKVLPIQFRAHFNNVYCIIDAFEIQIMKPSNPLFQSLTYSEYKKCNTLKYIIAVTPDGTIILVSQGYGDRISDVLLFELCGIIDILPENSGILADRGFKQIDDILNRKIVS